MQVSEEGRAEREVGRTGRQEAEGGKEQREAGSEEGREQRKGWAEGDRADVDRNEGGRNDPE